MLETEIAEKASILVVDDDPIARTLMHETLAADGYSVIEAADGMEGYLLYHEYRPDLMLLDLMMPRMDGYQLCRILRARAESASAPIVVTTGHDDLASISRAYHAGATDFIAKPVNWLVLKHRIRHILRANRILAEARRDAEQLVSAKEAAEAANEARAEFLSNVSHELRTRLNAIVGFSDMIGDRMFGPIDEKYAEYASIIGESGRHLLAVITDTLGAVESDEDRSVLVEERVELGDIVALATKMVGEIARRGRIELVSEVDAALPPVMGDTAKLTQILVNLLTNSVKFTAPGGHVGLKVERHDGRGILFRIEDNGVGMSRDQIPIALAPFGQLNNSPSGKQEGIGIGLPLTKRLVELHGGTLELESEPGKGTVVIVRLPETRVCRSEQAPPA
jgi:signal transduction histidine kinase